MRKSVPLSLALFGSPVMEGILSATTLRPSKEWYLSDLAGHMGVTPSTLQRTLAKLTQAGLLLRRRDGNRVYYRADPDCPILPELAGILTKTSGVAEPVREALRPLADRIALAFIHGSVAEGRERSESDIDLLAVGQVSGSELALALRPLRVRLGREVNATRYTAREFAEKVSSGDHFLTAVLGRPRIFVIGDNHGLEQLAGRAAGGPGAHKLARA